MAMKLEIVANSPQGVLEEIVELARRNAAIEDGMPNAATKVIEQTIKKARAQALRTFAAMISGATVRMKMDPRLVRAKELLEEGIGRLGSEPEKGDDAGAAYFQAVADLQTEIGSDRNGAPIPATNEIQIFWHCRKCVEEVKQIAAEQGTASPRDYARLSVGFTPLGLQVWCVRHDQNVAHIDFEGCQHPANMHDAPKSENAAASESEGVR